MRGTPGQAANAVNAIADFGGLPVSATAVRPATAADLVTYLQQPDTAVIVTIGGDDANVPDIARTSDTANSAGGGVPGSPTPTSSGRGPTRSRWSGPVTRW